MTEEELKKKEEELKKKEEELKKKETDYETKAIKTIKESYESQIAELKKSHEEEIKKVRDEEQDRSAKQIKALMSGRTEENLENNPAKNSELSFEEQLLIDTQKNFGIKNVKED